jgi:1,4-alpha-glucan branching enzyme
MLSPADAQALVQARHHDPFAVLGMHADAAAHLWVRALLPGAQSVQVLDAASGRSLVSLKPRHEAGLFESVIPRRKNRFDYRLNVQWANGSMSTMADAYSVGSLLDAQDLQQFAAGTHAQAYRFMGAHCMSAGTNLVEGVRFAVWAPNASRVSVVGDFNTWDGRRHMMRLHHGSGVWEVFVPHAQAGDSYKFELLDANGSLLPLKADPYARAAQLRPDTASIVAKPIEAIHKPLLASASSYPQAMSIYEVHAGSWRRHEDGSFYTWQDLARELPAYVAQLGFTHIELMPITEHPFDGSWGYQTLGLFAPTARFGVGLGGLLGFKQFVDACHAQGLGLILDWVPAHFPLDAHGLATFDGTSLYDYADPREGFHQDWNTAIYNFSRHEVRNFLRSSAVFWLKEMGVDGLRVDAVASMIYRDYSRKDGEWIANVYGGRENLEVISLLKDINEHVQELCPGALIFAEESTTYPKVSYPVEHGGLGFDYKWNMGWMNDTLRYMQEDPVHRRWHHDKMTFGLIYAFNEHFVLPLSHDEVVHGKRSLLGRMPGDDWQRFANLRAYYGFMWAHPGKKLLFMGQELAQIDEWNHDQALPWHLLQQPSHHGVQQLVRDLNRLQRQYSPLHMLDTQSQGFEWLEAGDAEQSVLAWLRHDGQGHAILVVCNFTPVPRAGYRLGMPAHFTQFKEVLNTDAAQYGGSNLGNMGAVITAQPVAAQGKTHSISLHLPPLATLYLYVE